MIRRPQPPASAPRRRLRGDDGSVIAELALVSPILIMLALGIFEYGFVLRDSNVLANGLRAAARTGSQVKTDPAADLLTLQTLMATTSKLKNATVTKVIIYKSTAADGAVPTACVNAVTSGNAPYTVTGSLPCNIYVAKDLTPANLVASNFNCSSGSTATPRWDKNWCPGGTTPRNANLAGTIDSLGVYAEVTYTGITGLLPGKKVILKDKAVNRIEPL